MSGALLTVDSIAMFQVRMHLLTPFRASSHAATALDHILVRLTAGEHEGWGECSAPADPYYLGETVASSWDVLAEFLAPAVVSRSFSSIEELVALYGNVKGNTFARAAIETAGWDLLGRSQGVSVRTLLGGTRTTTESGVSLGMEDSVSALLDHVERHVAEGYKRIKVKVAPGKDRAVLEGLRRRFPSLPIMGDANSAYRLEDAPHLASLDDLDLMMLEQPLAWDDLVDHAALQELVKTPICLDESIRSDRSAAAAIELRSCRIVNVKAGRVGGLLEARRIHDRFHAAGIPMWCGGMHDYGIGRAANLALSSLPGFSIPGDVSGSDKYFAEDIIDVPLRATNGVLAIPDGPGLGVTPRLDRILRRTVRARSFGKDAV